MNLRAFCLTATMTLSLLSNAAAQQPVIVELDTSEGKIVLELNAEKAPKTVANFLKYVESGHYEGTIFHRVIPDFMIQGGGLEENLVEKKTEAPVRNEAGNGLKNSKYTVALARKPDPHSATSQFFVNTADNAFLNRENSQDGYGYTVFGKVTSGTEVVDAIANVRTKAVPNPEVPSILMRDVPVNSVVIKSAKVLDKK